MINPMPLPTQPLPLVTVILLTYNSVRTVQETLDSIAQQDCEPLELIVCDDGSSDGTIALVERWTRQHAARFVRIELLSTPRNLGVCANLARGYAAAAGEWIKGIAGDDLLLPGAITRYMARARDSDAAVVVASVRKFWDGTDGSRQFGELVPTPEHRADLTLTGTKALRRWASENPVPAPGALIRRSAIEAVGGIDDAFVHLDDWPLWMRMHMRGMSFLLLEEPLAAYRVSAGSVSTKRLAVSIDPRYLRDLALFYKKYQKQWLPPLERVDRAIEVFRWRLAAGLLRNHPTLYKATRGLFFASPLKWWRLFRSQSLHDA